MNMYICVDEGKWLKKKGVGDVQAGVRRAQPALEPAATIVLEFPTSVTHQDGRKAPRRQSVARSCDICGKGPVFGNQISHAHNVSSRVWYPNIQKVRVVVGKAVRRKRVCTRCLRSGAVVKAAS